MKAAVVGEPREGVGAREALELDLAPSEQGQGRRRSQRADRAQRQ